ncbi:hypothetical protein L7F22_064444 [Adiantum nelumboides]|nr:hypothetical protein [Adiantum nelumboides]
MEDSICYKRHGNHEVSSCNSNKEEIQLAIGDDENAYNMAMVVVAREELVGGAADDGKTIHDEISRQGLLQHNLGLSNTLVSLYAKCGALGQVQIVLEEFPSRNVNFLSALIARYAQDVQDQHCLCFLSSLKTCAKKKDLNQGCRIRANIHHSGLLEKSAFLANTIVSMYVKCGALIRAQEVVDELSIRNVVSWNTLIAGYVQQGQGKEALCCFHQLQSEGLSPDVVTYACVLKACGITD